MQLLVIRTLLKGAWIRTYLTEKLYKGNSHAQDQGEQVLRKHHKSSVTRFSILTDETAAPVHHRVTGHAGLWLLQQVRLQPSASHRTGDRQVRAEVHRRVGVLLQRERENHVPQLRAREHPRQMPPKTSRLH